MEVDTAKKQKSVAAIGLIMVGPVVVPDSSIDAGDRQVIGYSYSGTTAVDNSATFVAARNAALNIATATATLET